MPACRELTFSGDGFGVVSESMLLLRCTIVGEIVISGMGDIVLTGGWRD